jgi:hypothetical protein
MEKKFSICLHGEAPVERTLNEIFTVEDTHECLMEIYGRDIKKECEDAAVGQTVSWHEPIMGDYSATRIF